jgi:hypothetical protein
VAAGWDGASVDGDTTSPISLLCSCADALQNVSDRAIVLYRYLGRTPLSTYRWLVVVVVVVKAGQTVRIESEPIGANNQQRGFVLTVVNASQDHPQGGQCAVEGEQEESHAQEAYTCAREAETVVYLAMCSNRRRTFRQCDKDLR